MQISSIQQTQNTNFKAKLQLTGNTSLLKNEQTQALKTIVDKIGSKTDIIDVNLSEKIKTKGLIPIAVWANNKLSQFLGEFKDDDFYLGVINALEQTKDIFPSVATIIATSLAVNKANGINDNVDKNIPCVSEVEDTLIDNESDRKLLEKIKTKIDEFIFYREHSLEIPKKLHFIDILLINGIHNDKSLKEEYSSRMQKESFYYDFDDGHYEFINYTGDDFKDGIKAPDAWAGDSLKTIHHMLWEPELIEKMEKSIFKFLKSKKALDNFSFEQLEDYYNKINAKFKEFIEVASATDTGSRFITKDHPMVNYIDDVAQNNSYLSTYLVEESKKQCYARWKDNEVIKACEVKDVLQNGMFKTLLLSQLLLNSPCQLQIEEQKEFLDKFAQCKTRENTKEELDIIAKIAENDYILTVII